jgi:hypothetical protein
MTDLEITFLIFIGHIIVFGPMFIILYCWGERVNQQCNHDLKIQIEKNKAEMLKQLKNQTPGGAF